mgnify:FL=1
MGGPHRRKGHKGRLSASSPARANARGAVESLYEERRDVTGYEGVYQVSSLGRVRNMAAGRGRRGIGYILRPNRNNGYLSVNLWDDGVCVTKRIHRLVLDAFGGIKDSEDTHHDDGDGTNNSIMNLVALDRTVHSAMQNPSRPPVPVTQPSVRVVTRLERTPRDPRGGRPIVHCELGSHKCKECRRLVRRHYYERKGR